MTFNWNICCRNYFTMSNEQKCGDDDLHKQLFRGIFRIKRRLLEVEIISGQISK